MDIARMRTYILITGILIGFAILRVVINANPIYTLLEPVSSRLSGLSSEFSLTNTNAETTSEVSLELDSLRSQNEKLRDLSNLSQVRDTINVEVIRRNLLGFEKNVWVGRGSESGVAVGQTVLFEGQLFGIVERVFPDSAEVKVMIDPHFRSTVSIGSEQGVIKIDHGSILVDLVPDKTLEGARVTTNGIDGLLSAGVTVGRLGAIASDEGEVFATYPLQLSYSPYKAEFLQIIIDTEGSLR